MAFVYGAKPDPKDERDLLYKAARRRAAVIPDHIDLRPNAPPVRDQGNIGSCVPHGTTAVHKYLQIAGSPIDPPQPEPVKPPCFGIPTKLWRGAKKRFGVSPFTDLSPLFLYYEGRKYEGSFPADAGMFPRDAFKIMAKGDSGIGCAREEDWQYDTARFNEEPPQAAYDHAADYRFGKYWRLNDLDEELDALAAKLAITIGFAVYDSFEQQQNMTTGRMPMPKKTESIRGYHLVSGFGYHKDPTWEGGGYLIIQNSWSVRVHDNGYFYMPFAYVIEKGFVTDLWTGTL